jgi:hypothetical protein
MNDADYLPDRTVARNPTRPESASQFATFRCLPDGNGGWLDPLVDVGVMVGTVMPSEQFARFLAKRLAKGGGCPIAVVEIFPRHGRQVVAVIGDEVPPLVGTGSITGRAAA